jgi:uncharacterized protein YwqG
MSELSPPLRAELDAAISRRQLDSVAEEIRSNAAECYAMITVGEDDYSTVGNTRFGGDPDLPVGMVWPIDPDNLRPTYSNFIAQINFAELPLLASNTSLPSRGILYLFVRYRESAAEPVILDSLYFDGNFHSLVRRQVPDSESLCDEYLVDLVPQRIQAVPAVSLAYFRKRFRKHVKENALVIDGEDGESRLLDLGWELHREGQLGQMLGFANAGDVRENLYRQVVLARLGRRRLVYNDYWETMQEYNAYIEYWRERGNEQLVKTYNEMKEGVEWLTSNRTVISNEVDQWKLLFQLDSNSEMNLNINDADPLYVFVRDDDLASRAFADLAGEVTQG